MQPAWAAENASVAAFPALPGAGCQAAPDMLAAQAFGTSGSAPVLCYEELLAAEAGAEPGFRWVDVDENDACGLCYTSGTTGRPKVGLLPVSPPDVTVFMCLTAQLGVFADEQKMQCKVGSAASHSSVPGFPVLGLAMM